MNYDKKDISEEKRIAIGKEFHSMTSNFPLDHMESDKLAKDWIQLRKETLGCFVNGTWLTESNETHNVVNPCSGEELAKVHLANDQITRRAISSAAMTSEMWAELSGHERGRYLFKVARNIQKHQELFTVLESICVGKPIRRTRSQDIPLLIQCFFHFAGVAMVKRSQMQNLRPKGVVYIIAACHNNPLLMCWHVSAALACGNTVVLEIDAPDCLSALLLAELTQSSGLPAGVFNVLPNNAPAVCYYTLPSVRYWKVFFIGHFKECQKVQEWADKRNVECERYSNVRPTVIVLEGADQHSAVSGILECFCFNDSRGESAGCNVLVQDSIERDFMNKLSESFVKLRAGNCLSNADLSVITKKDIHMKGFSVIERLMKEKAKVVSLPHYPEDGVLFDPPSLVWHIQTPSQILEEEVYGQFLTVVSFRTTKEAIALFNHGRSGDVSIWCEEIAPVLEVADKLKTGTVWINCQNLHDVTAFGGVLNGAIRGSGELGLFHFMAPKRIQKQPQGEKKPDKTLRSKPVDVSKTYELYYGGEWKKPQSNTYFTVYNTEDLAMAQVPESSAKDICSAVASAVAAQAKWGAATAFQRSQILFSTAEHLEERQDEFVSLLQETSLRDKEVCSKEVAVTIEKLFYWAAYCDKIVGTSEGHQIQGKVLQNYEPSGVVAVVCPDEYPLLSFVSLLAPLIAVGSSVVAVPSITCPIPALVACQVFGASGIPAGVVNTITLLDFSLTENFARHMEVDTIWMAAGFKTLNDSVRRSLAISQKRVFEYLYSDDEWLSVGEGKEKELLFHATYSKTIWMPMGDIFAN